MVKAAEFAPFTKIEHKMNRSNITKRAVVKYRKTNIHLLKTTYKPKVTSPFLCVDIFLRRSKLI